MWPRRLWLMFWLLPGLGLTLHPIHSSVASDVSHTLYYSQPEFLRQVFNTEVPARKLLILDQALNIKASGILGHHYPSKRIRYWKHQTTTAWIFDEVGKDMPITLGIVIDQNKIQRVEILVYREERGGEVHHAFFKNQFEGLTLTQDDTLSNTIDGITGATLSVNAVTRVATLALALHRHLASKE